MPSTSAPGDGVGDLVGQLPAQRPRRRARARGRARWRRRSARAPGRTASRVAEPDEDPAPPGGVRVGELAEAPTAPRPTRRARPSAPSSTSCGTPLPSNTPTTIVSAPVSRRVVGGGPDAPCAGGYRQSHAQDRDPRHRAHPRRQARRRPSPCRPPSWAASPSRPRSSAPTSRPSRCSTSSWARCCRPAPGQIPSRQAQIGAGIPKEVSSETINKVCASGVRAAGMLDAGDPRGRRRGRRRRRHGVDVAGAVPAAAGPLRRAHGRHEGARRDGPRRAHEPVHAASRCSSRRPRSATSWR